MKFKSLYICVFVLAFLATNCSKQNLTRETALEIIKYNEKLPFAEYGLWPFGEVDLSSRAWRFYRSDYIFFNNKGYVEIDTLKKTFSKGDEIEYLYIKLTKNGEQYFYPMTDIVLDLVNEVCNKLENYNWYYSKIREIDIVDVNNISFDSNGNSRVVEFSWTLGKHTEIGMNTEYRECIIPTGITPSDNGPEKKVHNWKAKF